MLSTEEFADLIHFGVKGGQLVPDIRGPGEHYVTDDTLLESGKQPETSLAVTKETSPRAEIVYAFLRKATGDTQK
jgi:hypothetical protein